MKIFIDQTIGAVKKRRMAVIVSTSTNTIIACSMFVISTLKPSDIFANTTKLEELKQVQKDSKIWNKRNEPSIAH
ncbi:MAG: putative membrane protein [bacterium]|jgi:uncharacterized membrane protein